MDSEVGGHLLDRHTRAAVPRDSHDVLAELFRIGLGHSEILPTRPTGQASSDVTDRAADPITVLHIASRKTYGVPCIHAELRRLGRRVNRKRIARVMRERDIRGVTRRKHRSLTRPDTKAKPART
ncbi:IS3 family transposase [Streptomyces chartreusis]|uniref:IS3 family transposase n=1 Tax=Streptomyces chartreusis TaxID=1969 RepID=UPI003682ACAA